MVEKDEQDVATMMESVTEDLLNLIKLDRQKYQLISYEKEQVVKWEMGEIKHGWTCQTFKRDNKCLSGQDEYGRVNATTRFKYCDLYWGIYVDHYFCDKCVKADLLMQLFQLIQRSRNEKKTN